MKIMLVTPYYEPSIGGVQRYVKDIVGTFHDHEIVIVTTKLDQYQSDFEQFKKVKIYRLPVLLKIANTPYHPFWKRYFRDIYRKEQPDIINAHAPVPFFADIAQRASRGRIPFVLTYHSGSMKKGDHFLDALIHIYEKFVLPKTLRSASRIISVYPDFIHRLLAGTRCIDFIPPGIDTSYYLPKNEAKIHDCVFVGRLEKDSSWKGLDVALQAIAELKQKGHAATLHIVGDGNAMDDYIQKVSLLAIEDCVTFAGALEPSGVRDAINASRMIILPSLTESESFGMVVAEAASCQVPAIGSRVGGIPNVISDNQTGLLVPPQNPLALANAIEKLLDNKSVRKKFGLAARERINDLYSIQQFRKKTERAFEQTMRHPNPLNIQVVAYYPPALGGMEQVAENMAIELVESGQSVEVVTSTIGANKPFQDIDQDGYKVRRLFAKKIAGLPVIPSLLFHLLRKPVGSIYHVHVAQAFIPEFALIAAKIRRGKFIVHFHLDVPASGTFGAVFTAYKRTLFPYMMQHADKVIVFSEEQQKLVETKYGVKHDKVHILPNGVRRGFERHEKRTIAAKPRVLFVGRLSHQKNIRFLLDSLNGISDKFTTHIVGDGELRKSLEQHSDSLHLKNVHFVGRKDGDDLRKEYDEADIFILPSEREGMPLVLIDAMAMRLPSIGSDVLGIRDLIQDGKNGFIVPLNDSAAMRKAIVTIAESPALYGTMSQNAYETTRELSWPYLIKRLLSEVYT